MPGAGLDVILVAAFPAILGGFLLHPLDVLTAVLVLGKQTATHYTNINQSR